ncbi:unnamed protein product [Linum trigynum]|uniref:Uncharacterized protein n=1 Tax=Linum trigynum TaxID=586398 RepID=A0AAV2F1T4_9ROSI
MEQQSRLESNQAGPTDKITHQLPLERNARRHWIQAAQSLTLNVWKIFSDADLELSDACLFKFQEHESWEGEI